MLLKFVILTKIENVLNKAFLGKFLQFLEEFRYLASQSNLNQLNKLI